MGRRGAEIVSRLSDHIEATRQRSPKALEELLDKIEGDSEDTEVADDNDAPPGQDPRR